MSSLCVTLQIVMFYPDHSFHDTFVRCQYTRYEFRTDIRSKPSLEMFGSLFLINKIFANLLNWL